MRRSVGKVRGPGRRYFKERFPRLLLTTFCFALRHCSGEPAFAQYLPPAAAEFPFQTPAGAAKRATERDGASGRASAPPQARLVHGLGLSLERKKGVDSCRGGPPSNNLWTLQSASR